MLKDYLYYQDAYIKEFTATVLHTGQEEDGRAYVVLSNTAFYPTGGGQPHDTGMIQDLTVNDVEKINDEIRHYVEDDVSTLTGEVIGKIDWVRRFDHMQQHTGQHILTAAFVELFGFSTVSFHLGTGLVSIDLATDSVTDAQLVEAEARANEIILENRPVETKWITEDELPSYNLRKDITVKGNIRLVIIPDFDYNGCGGTHPTSTGQVSAIKIMAIEKMKGNIRLSFVCGNRVLQELTMRKNVLSDVARQLSVPEEAAGDALKKVLLTSRTNEKALAEAQDALLGFKAKELVTSANNNIVTAIFENRPVQALQKLGRLIVEESNEIIALLVTKNDNKLQFVAAKGASVEVSMKSISAAILPLVNGKGGGNDRFVQGGGEAVITAEALLDKMKEVL